MPDNIDLPPLTPVQLYNAETVRANILAAGALEAPDVVTLAEALAQERLKAEQLMQARCIETIRRTYAVVAQQATVGQDPDGLLFFEWPSTDDVIEQVMNEAL